MSRRANRFRKTAELMLAQEQNPEAKVQAKRDGIAVGKRVRYGSGRQGVVKELRRVLVKGKYIESAVVQLSAEGLLRGGKDIVVREEEVALSDVHEILGDGRLAEPKVEKRPIPMAPPRENPYTTCDFAAPPIFEVIPVKGRGLVALCKEHAKDPTDDEPEPFKFKLGLLFLARGWKNWPRPDETLPEQSETRARNHPPTAKAPMSDSPFEGKRGRHPLNCTCSKHSESR